MELKLFKTLWGFSGSPAEALSEARADGYDGIEGPPPAGAARCRDWREQLADHGLAYIAEVCTTGQYVADRRQGLAQHLDDIRAGIDAALNCEALFVTCLGGCDAWPMADSVTFFASAQAIAASAGIAISFETHRGRSLFNPWIARDIVAELPDLKLTADLSHWCVVTERLLDTENEELSRLFSNVHHVHARVGYAQGPQVPDPSAPRYAGELARHESWWQAIWASQRERGYRMSTMTPEFGPDGYLHHDPATDQPVADLRTINNWIAERERDCFAPGA